MSEENVGALREVYSEWARGNFDAGTELYAADVVCSWQVPEGQIVSHGVHEVRRNFGRFLEQWRHFRIAVEEFVELDESTILVVVKAYGRGKHSGAETVADNFHAWVFERGEAVGHHVYFDREAAITAVGLRE